ncbi:MAG TPA: glycogen debranching N-terminal domain-containing protein [Longimicrobiales bacterium]
MADSQRSDERRPAGAHSADLVPASALELLGYEGIACDVRSLAATELVLKENRFFLLTDAAGNIAPAGACEMGLFFEDTRFLSHYELLTAGGKPDVLSSQAARVFVSQIDLTITDREFGGEFTEPKNFMHIRREQLLDDSMADQMVFTNYLGRPVEFWAELRFAADFADIFEVRGAFRPRRGQFFRPLVGETEVVWVYRGLDGVLRRTRLQFSLPPDELEDRRALWRFPMQPRDSVRLEVRIFAEAAGDAAPPARPFGARLSALRAAYDEWRQGSTQFRSDDDFFNAALDQAIVDLRALMVDVGGERVIAAGIPWFTTPFGRDSIITSLEVLPVSPAIARACLRFLASLQGTRVDEFTEEEPGKIPHELRRGEMAACREVPHVPYYGSADATPLFAFLLAETVRWTADLDFARELLPAAERALAWIDNYGDLDGDGFVEYIRRSPRGLLNQGWKDSHDGVVFPDGTLPRQPIALVEVQGYVVAAKQGMAALYEVLGDAARAAKLRDEASALAERIRETFWMEDLGYFALALDGEKRQVPTITSNPGHLLLAGVPTPEQARRMAEVLLGEHMFSGWGIRTVARTQPIYNPLSYHNGTVWPHDNALIAMGFARYGLRREAGTILGALFDTSLYFRYHRLPELFCGIWRGETDAPVAYPVSCSPQAWAAGALFPIVQAVLGIEPHATREELHLVRPYLPPRFRYLDVLRLRVGASRVSLQFNRVGERTMANVLAVEGEPLNVRIDVV